MGKLETELFIIKMELNSFYGFKNNNNDKILYDRFISIKRMLRKTNNRKSIISL